MPEDKSNIVSLKTQIAKVAIASLTALPLIGVGTAYAHELNVTHPVQDFGLLPGESKTIDLKSVFADVYGTIDHFGYYRNDSCSPSCVSEVGWLNETDMTQVVFQGLNSVGSTPVTLEGTVTGLDSGNGLLAEHHFNFQVGHVVANKPWQKKNLLIGNPFSIVPAELFKQDNADVLSYNILNEFDSATVTKSIDPSGNITLIWNLWGTTTVNLQATSVPNGYSAVATYEVVVDTPPQLKAGITKLPQQSIMTNQTVTLDLLNYFEDADTGAGDSLHFEVESGNPLVETYLNSGMEEATPHLLDLSGLKPGATSIRVTATDSLGLDSVKNIEVNVAAPVLETGRVIKLESIFQGAGLLVDANTAVDNGNVNNIFNSSPYKVELSQPDGAWQGILPTQDMPEGLYKFYFLRKSGNIYEIEDYVTRYFKMVHLNENTDPKIDIADLVKNFRQHPRDLNEDGIQDFKDWNAILNLIAPKELDAEPVEIYVYPVE
jgi:hypothetical protein